MIIAEKLIEDTSEKFMYITHHCSAIRERIEFNDELFNLFWVSYNEIYFKMINKEDI